jgi:filamentous hemagglutinin
VTQVASNAGSLAGNVNLTAGGQYTQTASSVVAASDINLTAAAIDLKAAANTRSAKQESESLKIGAFAHISSPLISLANDYDAVQKADGRLQDLQQMAVAADAYKAASAISSTAGGPGSGELVKVEAGVGFAASDSSSGSQSSTSKGSTLAGGNNVTLTTTEGDLHIVQGNLGAGNTLTLDSAQDLILEAGQSISHSESDGSSSGVEVGVGASVGAQTGIYAYGRLNFGGSNANSDSVLYSNTHLTAGQSIDLNARGDNTLRGATAKAGTINVNTGGDLTIESLQDRIKSESDDSGFKLGVQISFGTAWSLTAGADLSGMDGTYANVTEQSGLFAKDGGYHINADTVNLIGGAIASTNPDNSELTTSQLTYSDIENYMSYDVASMSFNGSYDYTAKQDGPKPTVGQQLQSGVTGGITDTLKHDANTSGLTGGLPIDESGGDRSTTYATLTEGKITIGGQQTTAEATGIHTDLSDANPGVEKLPDLKKIQSEQKAINSVATKVSSVVGTVQQVAKDIAKYQGDLVS